MIKALCQFLGIAAPDKASTETSKASTETPSEYAGFAVEHYPETNRYYPVYKGKYLQVNWSTGIVDLMEPFLFAYASYGHTEADAWKIVDKYREQRLKVNVKVITR